MCSEGSCPPPGAPVADQLTVQVMVAVTSKAPSFESPSALGCPADDSGNAYEQAVDCAASGIVGSYGVPGPSHTTVCPSPMDHETLTGVAIAVALTPPAVAVARKLCQVCGSIQSHELRLTMLKAEGLRLTIGEGSVSRLVACKASALGTTAGGAALTGDAAGNHESAPV